MKKEQEEVIQYMINALTQGLLYTKNYPDPKIKDLDIYLNNAV